MLAFNLYSAVSGPNMSCLFMQMFLSNVTVNGQVRQVRMGRFHGDGPDGRVLCSQPMVVPETS